MWALIDTDTTADTEAFRNVRLSGFIVKNDAFLSVANWRAKIVALIVALLWLTIVFLQNCDSHLIPPMLCFLANVF
mgnify:CR=1 FL=1|jgi:hypothetical protein